MVVVRCRRCIPTNSIPILYLYYRICIYHVIIYNYIDTIQLYAPVDKIHGSYNNNNNNNNSPLDFTTNSFDYIIMYRCAANKTNKPLLGNITKVNNVGN